MSQKWDIDESDLHFFYFIFLRLRITMPVCKRKKRRGRKRQTIDISHRLYTLSLFFSVPILHNYRDGGAHHTSTFLFVLIGFSNYSALLTRTYMSPSPSIPFFSSPTLDTWNFPLLKFIDENIFDLFPPKQLNYFTSFIFQKKKNRTRWLENCKGIKLDVWNFIFIFLHFFSREKKQW